MDKKYIIGIDLGINNVGWSIIDKKTFEIIECGVLKFEPSEGAAKRRKFRAARRLKRRSLHRVERLAQLLKKNGINPQKSYEDKMLDKRILGLKEKLTIQEIVNIIYYFARHRGYIPYDDTKLERETLELKDNEYPCEYIKKHYDENGVYRNSVALSKYQDNNRELKQILITQSNYYPEINAELIEDIIKIINSKRQFYEGPGSPKLFSLSPFGRYRTKEDIDKYNEDPNYRKYLYEELIGKCQVLINEKRAPSKNFYAEEFNFYNDIINTKVKEIDELDERYSHKVEKDGHLTKQAIQEIKEEIINAEKVAMSTIFKKILGLTFDNLTGYRVDKKYKPEFSTFEFYRYVRKQFSEHGSLPKWLQDDDKTYYNKIIYTLTVSPSSKQIKEMLEDLLPEYQFNDEELSILQRIKEKKNEDLKYHSLSEKMLKITLLDMKKTNYQRNYMQLFHDNDYDKEKKEFIKNNYSKKISEPFLMEDASLDDLILNPQVKKTLKKAIAIINAIIKKMKNYPDVIAIESTREMNSKDDKIRIEAEQKRLEKLRKDAKKFLEENGFGVNEKNIDKALCYFETGRRCIYCNKPISISEFPSLDIEHILPISKSFDNSYNNRTISCSDCNKNKGNKTPHDFILSSDDFKEFKARVEKLKDMPLLKKNNLLTTENIDRNTIRFINRNLRDTAYGSKALAQEVNKYNIFLQHRNGCKVNVLTVPGQLTSKIRGRIKAKKDRDTLYHHAVDASIIASVACTKIGEMLVKFQNDRQYYFNLKKNERDELYKYIENFNIKNIKEIKGIKDDKINISYEVKTDPRGQLSDQNYIKIIKRNDNYYKIDQIDNIYAVMDENKQKFEKLFDENDTTCELLCQKNDPKLYALLKDIYFSNKDNKNPFLNYCLYEHGIETAERNFKYLEHGIRKNPKKANSPIVKKLRYKTKINDPYILQKERLNNKENRNNEFIKSPRKDKTLVGLNSLSQYCVEIYYDYDKQEYIFLPIYTISMDLNKGVINRNEHYYRENYQAIIGEKKTLLIGTIQTGECATIIKKDGTEIFNRFSTYDKTNKLLAFKLNSNEKKDHMTKNDQGIIIYRTDCLGKRYKKLDSQEKIKKHKMLDIQ